MIRSKPANQAYLDNWDRIFGEADAPKPIPSEGAVIPMPADRIRYNGSGTPCDVLKGPCSCGAWHTGDEPTEVAAQGDVRVTCRHCDCHVFVAKRAEMLTCPRCGGVSEIRP